ncbi:OadG family protein [Psychrobium sp. MM17-31]|uniref:OadG family protein n=1 Tax=Psychrobium sp. MM17-31 TaxID=2917758 RepID=UPI001EF65A36|nr:OadG family transporter subunit [Psychrobium sp. MM17-31]MCG7530903.1 OadG family protein [Psychrobium sp. MM17-31]
MDITQALSTAANIMLLGMVCVFTFLSILVVAIKLLERFAGGEVEQPTAPKPVAPAQQGIDNNIVAAISGAVHQYRQSNK